MSEEEQNLLEENLRDLTKPHENTTLIKLQKYGKGVDINYVSSDPDIESKIDDFLKETVFSETREFQEVKMEVDILKYLGSDIRQDLSKRIV